MIAVEAFCRHAGGTPKPLDEVLLRTFEASLVRPFSVMELSVGFSGDLGKSLNRESSVRNLRKHLLLRKAMKTGDLIGHHTIPGENNSPVIPGKNTDEEVIAAVKLWELDTYSFHALSSPQATARLATALVDAGVKYVSVENMHSHYFANNMSRFSDCLRDCPESVGVVVDLAHAVLTGEYEAYKDAVKSGSLFNRQITEVHYSKPTDKDVHLNMDMPEWLDAFPGYVVNEGRKRAD